MYTIVQAQPEDLLPVCEYFNQMFKTPPLGLYARPEGMQIGKVEGLINDALASDASLFLLAKYKDGNVVGTLTFNRYEKLENRHVGDFGISVHPEHRHEALGEALIRGMEKWAKQHEVRKIELEVWSNNIGAVRLYNRLGYLIEGIRKETIMRDDQVLDIILMGKLLRNE